MSTTAPDAVEGFDHAFDQVNFTDPIGLIEVMLGVTPELVQEYDLTRIDPEERVQVRIDKNNAPREMVERFAGQMSFSQFPPIVVTEDGRIVDGNTRFRARLRREDRYCAALVIPVSWEGADEERQTRLEYLGLALNNSNGKALDRVERRKMVRDALELGMSAKQITQTVGFPASIITAIRHEINAERRLKAVGIEPEEIGIRDASLRALGKAVDLNDAPFAELARLSTSAGFNANEVGALATSVRETGSDELGLERIGREREANAQRIADRERGGDGHPPAARLLRQRLGFITGREPSALTESNREMMHDHLEAIEGAIERLQLVAAEQRALIEAQR